MREEKTYFERTFDEMVEAFLDYGEQRKETLQFIDNLVNKDPCGVLEKDAYKELSESRDRAMLAFRMFMQEFRRPDNER